MASDPSVVPPPGTRASRHDAQVFDDKTSLATTVAAYVEAGWHAGDTLLIVATAAHWSSIQQRLDAMGLPVAEAIDSGRLIVRDAWQTLAGLQWHERLDPVRFDVSVGRLVRTLVERGRPLRIFGEMVDLLAGAGDHACAAQLEELWNGLARRHPFRLLCGYSAASFGNPRARVALRRMCDAHQQVRSAPPDLLGTFLVDRAREPSC
jgi:hypothetical protein